MKVRNKDLAHSYDFKIIYDLNYHYIKSDFIFKKHVLGYNSNTHNYINV
jgi:hypothetical protein